MRPRALDLLVCPLDKQRLELRDWEGHPTPLTPEDRQQAERLGITPESVEREIDLGVLVNPRLKIFYPIYEGVPRLLTFSTAMHESFMEIHGERCRKELPGFSLPDETAMPGEKEVVASFSPQWVDYDWDGESYWELKPAEMFRVMDFLLDVERHPLQGKKVLEVGIGIGGIANNNSRSHGCELVGIDLSYAAGPAHKHFGSKNPFFHVVQASALWPPFADDTFDFVYSQGVLHVNFSTRAAVESVARLPRIGGRLYVWVYSPNMNERNLVRRGLWALERLIRPINYRLPRVLQTAILVPLLPLYMFRQRFISDGNARYGFREALHAARDRFTPRFAFRHTNEELSGWFRELGYDQLTCVADFGHPDYVPIQYVEHTGVAGERTRNVPKGSDVRVEEPAEPVGAATS